MTLLKWDHENQAIDNRIIPLHATGTLNIGCIWLGCSVGNSRKKKQWERRYGISWGIKKGACEISRVNWSFQGWPRKNSVEIPGDLVFGLGIFKGSNTILWTLQEWSFILHGISRGKKMKYSTRVFQKSMSSTPTPRCFFLE